MATPIPENAARFTPAELVSVTGGQAVGDLVAVEGLVTDSRRLSAGNLFVALRGDRFDGHRFVASAAEAGAAVALVEETLDAAIPQVVVASTLDALRALAAHHRERWRKAHGGRIAAITGSAGKTTTKSVIGRLVEAVAPGAAVVTAGNLNNLIGAPLTVLSLEPRHRFAVLEVGTSEPGEIPKLAALTEPDVAVVTLIDAAHTEGIGTIEDVAREKLALFAGAAPGALCVANLDDHRVAAGLAAQARGAGYGTGDPAEVAPFVMVRERVVTDKGQCLTLDASGRTLEVVVPLLGYAGALAVAAGIVVAESLTATQLTAPVVEEALADLRVEGRLAPREGPSVLVLDDSYNANPASCRASLRCAAEMAAAGGRRWGAVLGAMLELGELSEGEHRAVGALAVELGAGWVLGIAKDARYLVEAAGPKARFVEDAEAAVSEVWDHAAAGDLVLVKGSRSIATERVVDALLEGEVGTGGPS